jgi:hypothetical protein
MSIPEQNEKLLIELKKVMNEPRDSIARELLSGAWDAFGVHSKGKDFFKNSLTKRVLEDHLKSAFSAIKKINSGKGNRGDNLRKLNLALHNLGYANRSPLDTIFFEANDKDETLMRVVLPLEKASAFEMFIEEFLERPELLDVRINQEICIKMQRTIEQYLTNHIAHPGKGHRETTRAYFLGIELLARYFTEAYPENKLSYAKTKDNRESKFYRYVNFWQKHILQEKETDLRRHIKDVIESKHSRLHW